jgi:hypothetical protein
VFFEKEWSLWSLADGTRLRSVAPPANERLLRIGKNSSGDTIAVLYDEAPTNHDSVTVSTLNLMTGKAEARIELHDWHQVLVSLDARLAVMQGAQPLSVASVWDLCTGRHIRDIDGIDLGTHPHFASDNRHIVTELVDNSNETWKWLAVTDVESQARYIIDPGAPYRPAIACSPYAPRLVTIANDRRHPVDATRVWDVESGTLVGETTGHVGLARHVFSPCGRWLASVSNAAGGEMAVKSLPSGSVIITGL